MAHRHQGTLSSKISDLLNMSFLPQSYLGSFVDLRDVGLRDVGGARSAAVSFDAA